MLGKMSRRLESIFAVRFDTILHLESATSCRHSINIRRYSDQSSAKRKPILSPEAAKSKSGFLKYFDESLAKDGPLTGEEAYFMISSCGPRMSNESLSTRDELLRDVWTKLENHNVKLGVGLWNMRLRTHIMNGSNICPTTFLQEMEDAAYSVEPSQSTYELLAEACGVQGDIKNVQQMIGLIMARRGNITEHLYASFLQATAKKGDVESVKMILNSMKTNGLGVTHVSYNYILKGYADIGDMVKIDGTIREMVNNGLRPTIDTYMGIFDHLARGSHFLQLKLALSKVDNLRFLLKRLLAFVDELVASCNYESAFVVLRQFDPDSRAEATLYNTLGNARKKVPEYFRALQAVEKILEKPSFSRFEFLLRNLHFHSPDKASELLEYLMSKGEMRQEEVAKAVVNLYGRHRYHKIVDIANAFHIDLPNIEKQKEKKKNFKKNLKEPPVHDEKDAICESPSFDQAVQLQDEKCDSTEHYEDAVFEHLTSLDGEKYDKEMIIQPNDTVLETAIQDEDPTLVDQPFSFPEAEKCDEQAEINSVDVCSETILLDEDLNLVENHKDGLFNEILSFLEAEKCDHGITGPDDFLQETTIVDEDRSDDFLPETTIVDEDLKIVESHRDGLLDEILSFLRSESDNDHFSKTPDANGDASTKASNFEKAGPPLVLQDKTFVEILEYMNKTS